MTEPSFESFSCAIPMEASGKEKHRHVTFEDTEFSRDGACRASSLAPYCPES